MTEKETAVIAAAESQLGAPYVYGAWGGLCTPAYRQQYAGYNPSHADAIYKNCPVLSDKADTCAGCKWDGALAFDCRGFTHWCLEQAGITIAGGGATSQYNTKKNWTARGEISAMPDVVCCVFKRKAGSSTMLHTGLHIGDGRIIHCSVTVKESLVSGTDGWTHYAIPAGLYTDEEIEQRGVLGVVLQNGSRGDQVKMLQSLLTQAGYDCGKVDGIFGKKTTAALEAFQRMNGLPVDGVATENTFTALKIALDIQQIEQTEQTDGNADSDAQEPQEGGSDLVRVEIPIDAARALLAALAAQIYGGDTSAAD